MLCPYIKKSDNLQYNYINMLVHWVAGANDSSTKRLMFQALFFSQFLIDLGHSKLYFQYIKIMFAKNFARNHAKKIILGTSDAWSTNHLSQLTRESAYYIVDCRIYIMQSSHTCMNIEKAKHRQLMLISFAGY